MALRLLTRKAALTGTFIITLVVLTGVLAELRTVQSAGVSMFKVSNISVDETATDDLVAKNRGILKAQKWALRRVFQRLVLREDYHRLPGPKEAVLEQVIYGLQRRLSRPEELADAMLELQRLYQPLQEDFQAFYPQLQAFVAEQRRCED